MKYWWVLSSVDSSVFSGDALAMMMDREVHFVNVCEEEYVCDERLVETSQVGAFCSACKIFCKLLGVQL